MTAAVSRIPLAFLVFVVTLSAAGYNLFAHRPLLTLGGLTDEWFPIGFNVAAHGTLGWGDEPMLLRPPGYPAFIGGVLRLATRVPRQLSFTYSQTAVAVVTGAQALLLAATAAILYAWLRHRVGTRLALAAALLYGMSPYCLVLPGLLHYDVVHLFLLTAGCATLEAALRRAPVSLAPMALAGALWGITALVRPVTLPLPAFVAVMVLARGLRGARAASAVLAFSLAMAAVIAPWTARNYALTGRFIPINVQGWTVLWGSTVVPLRVDPNEYQWAAVASTFFNPIYRRVTGADYDYMVYLKKNEAIEAEFKTEALGNLRRQPGVYAWNVARGLGSLALQTNTAFVSVFQRIQRTGESVRQSWFWQGGADERAETRSSRATGAIAAGLTALAVLGLARGIVKRDAFLVVPVLVYLCIAIAHALTLVDLMYYYVRLPFLVTFAAVGADALGRWGRWIAAALLAATLATSAAVLFG
jgi:hypothetical protein